jgi:hypothetical protein
MIANFYATQINLPFLFKKMDTNGGYAFKVEEVFRPCHPLLSRDMYS